MAEICRWNPALAPPTWLLEYVMPLNSAFVPAIAKLVVIFAVMLTLLRLKFKLWQAILTGCAIVA